MLVLYSCVESTNNTSNPPQQGLDNNKKVVLNNLKFDEPLPSNDLEKMNLKGPVKSISTEHYEGAESFGEVVKGKPFVGEPFKSIYFNRRGNISYSKYKDFNSGNFVKFDVEYDSEQRVGSESNAKGITKYQYNNLGNVESTSDYDGNEKLVGKVTYDYDNYEGNQGSTVEKLTKLIYDQTGALDKRVLRYHERKLEDYREFYKENTIIYFEFINEFTYEGYEKYRYKTKYKQTTQKHYDVLENGFELRNHTIDDYFYTEFDYSKNLADPESVPEYPFNVVAEIKHIKDSSGRLTSKWTTLRTGLLENKDNSVSYDSDGNKTLRITVPHTDKVNYEYTVDEYDNLIKRVGKKEDGSPESISFRSIEYY